MPAKPKSFKKSSPRDAVREKRTPSRPSIPPIPPQTMTPPMGILPSGPPAGYMPIPPGWGPLPQPGGPPAPGGMTPQGPGMPPSGGTGVPSGLPLDMGSVVGGLMGGGGGLLANGGGGGGQAPIGGGQAPILPGSGGGFPPVNTLPGGIGSQVPNSPPLTPDMGTVPRTGTPAGLPSGPTVEG